MPEVARFPVEESDEARLRREQWRDLINFFGEMGTWSDESAGQPHIQMRIQHRFPSREPVIEQAVVNRIPGRATLPSEMMDRFFFLMALRRMMQLERAGQDYG